MDSSNLTDYQSIIASGVEYVDNEFPPNLASVFDPADHSEDANVNLYTSLEWKRAAEIYPEGYDIFPSEILADDIVQGQLGDCYFITCLAALTSKPEIIVRRIKND